MYPVYYSFFYYSSNSLCRMPTTRKWDDMQRIAAAYHCPLDCLPLSSFQTISSIFMKLLCSLDRLCSSCCSSVLNSLLQILHSLFVYFGFRLLFLQHAVIIAENIMADTIQVNHGIFICLLRISSFGRSGYNRDSAWNTESRIIQKWATPRASSDYGVTEKKWIKIMSIFSVSIENRNLETIHFELLLFQIRRV